mgnify:CR=1 FL=1
MIFSQCKLHNFNDVNWIDFYILLSKLSKSIRNHNEEQKKDNLILCIHDILCFARQNEIDMNSSWNRWYHKMDFKHYD